MRHFMSILAIALLLPVVTLADSDIDWQVISSGGTEGSSTSFQLMGTVGQTAVGQGSSTNFIVNQGYWQDFGGPQPCDCMPGDADGNELINISDAVYLINYIFGGGPAPIPYAICSGDADYVTGQAIYVCGGRSICLS